MTFVAGVARPKFDKKLWFWWTIASLLGWLVLVGLILIVDNIMLAFVSLFVGTVFLGMIEWFIIRNTYPWARWWVLMTGLGMILGIILIVLMSILALSFGLFGVFVGQEIFGIVSTDFGVLSSAILSVVGVSIAYLLGNYLIWSRIIIFGVSLEGIKNTIVEGTALVAEAVTAAVPLGLILVLFNNLILGIFVSGILFGGITGYYLKDILF
ncbi:MAG: hypothetical protein JSV04_15190 [Candidatus Heimdallarchaeota archaeon]|nr:MAG: hypothetical protein JSV04_15190 [Candidatus Heimdallarchaeota archaeon]